MYHLRFYRTTLGNNGNKYAFKQDSGYGVYVDGVEYALARTRDDQWDVTEVSTGLLVSVDRKTFATRDSALAWLREYIKTVNIGDILEKHSEEREALVEYKRPFEPRTHEQVGDITLTIKQADFLQRYKSEIGLQGFATKEIAQRVGISPMSVGAQISTLVEKGILTTCTQGQVKRVEFTEAGLKIMEDI